jgi:hypothetical protein
VKRVTLWGIRKKVGNNDLFQGARLVTITPSLRNEAKQALSKGQEKTLAKKYQSMTWAQSFKQFFGIESCEQCDGAVRIVARLHRKIARKSNLHSACPS